MPSRIFYCKWCGASDHVAGRECKMMRTKKGSKDSPTGQGDWTWFEPPPYHLWHATIERRRYDAELLGMDGEIEVAPQANRPKRKR